MPLDYHHDHENEITLFAETNFRNQLRRFGIKTDDRRRHMYIIGKTGMGKTTLIENMVLSDILAGHGVCYIDPHGDTAEKLLDFIPPSRINDVVYFNPSDFAYPLGFNILETVDDDRKHLVSAGLMGVFKKIWPDVWSARMEYILLNCVLALLDYPGATLLGINRLLVDAEYRKRVISAIKDPVVKTFWVAEFASWSEKYATEAIAPVQNKVGQFLSASIVRNIVAQVKSTIDLRDIMDSGKILIVNLSKGKIGEDNMRLLGGMLITKLSMAAMERVDIKSEAERRDFYLFVDEFQNFANESFASILSEARKYHLCLTVAHQYVLQLDEKVAAAVFGNVGTLVTFRVGGEDATLMEKEFTPTLLPEDLLNLAKYQVYLKLMVDGVATQPFSANTLAPIAKRTGSEEKVVQVSRERYASQRANIEEKVLRWSGMERGQVPDNISYPPILSEEEVNSAHVVPQAALKTAIQTTEEKAEESKTDDAAGGDYLKISPERLAAIVTPPQGQQPKKNKPMFPHTCSRCGKVWEMPIQLDTSRPIYCSECMPIVREEKKNKDSAFKAVKTQILKNPAPILSPKFVPKSSSNSNSGSKIDLNVPPKKTNESPPKEGPNRPRILGDLSALLKASKEDEREEDEEGGLLGQIMKAKGKPIETNKKKLTGGAPQSPPKH